MPDWASGWVRARYWLLTAIALTFVFASWTTFTKLEFRFSFWSLFDSADDESINLRHYTDQWGEDNGQFVVALTSKTGRAITVENIGRLDAFSKTLAALHGIDDVTSLTNVTTVVGKGDEIHIGPLIESLPQTDTQARDVEQRALDNNLIAGRILSKDATTLAVLVQIEPDLSDVIERGKLVEQVTGIADEIFANVELEPTIVGIPVAQKVYTQRLRDNIATFVLASVILLVTILAWMFRSVIAVVLTVGSVVTATLATLATMALLGRPINVMTSSIPSLIMVIGIADGIHLLSYYRFRLAEHGSPIEASASSLRHVGMSCFLTSLTTAVGFASLMSARVATVKEFGAYAALGIAYAFLANIMLVPAGLAVFRPHFAAAKLQRERLGDRLARIGAWNFTHPWRSVAIAAPLVAVMCWGVSLVESHSRMFEELSDNDPVVVAHRSVQQHLPGVTAYALDVFAPEGETVLAPKTLQVLDELAALAEAHPAVDIAYGLADVIKSLHRAYNGGDASFERVPDSGPLLAQYMLLAEGPLTDRLVNAPKTRTQVWMRGPEVTTDVWEDLRAELERAIKRADLQTKVVVTGSSAMAQRSLSAVIHDVMASLLGAGGVIFVIMTILFRSLRIGLIAMIPNALPLLATLGFMGFFGITLRTSTVVIFSVALGLAVDDTIHFLARYRHARETGSNREHAVERAMHDAGRPIVYTTIALVGGFWILLLSDFRAVRDEGLLGGVTLAVALYADIVLLPALLRLFDRAQSGR